MRWGLIWIVAGIFLFVLRIQMGVAKASDSAALYFQPRIGYQSPRFFQNSQTSTYPGPSYGAELYYRVLDFGGGGFGKDGSTTSSPAISIAPVIGVHYGKFENSANRATQRETLTEKSLSVGLKVYVEPFFIKAIYSWTDLRDDAIGTNTTSIQARSQGLGGGLGIKYSLSRHIGVELSAEVLNTSFAPGTNGFSAPTQYLRFGGFFGLSIAIPSSVGSNEGISKKKIFYPE